MTSQDDPRSTVQPAARSTSPAGPSAARLVGAVAGGLVAGLALTVLAIKGERDSGEPSELAELERSTARRVGLRDVPPDDALPDGREQATIQGGHLLLSMAAGAVYAAAVEEDAGVIASDVGFGLAFYAAMHWVAGPILGIKEPEWRAGARTIGMHAVNHVVFGLAAATGARLATANGE